MIEDVEVVRSRRARRITIRVFPNGHARLTIPYTSTLEEGYTFLNKNQDWVEKVRARNAAKPPRPVLPPLTKEGIQHFKEVIAVYHQKWATLFGEENVAIRYRQMKTMWAGCHWAKRVITYNLQLAHVPSYLYDYIVVHELTHFKAHNHGKEFKAWMDARLPNWRALRKELHSYSCR